MRDSTEATSKRVQDLEELNDQFEKTVWCSWTVNSHAFEVPGSDLRHEEELMRDVIVQQNQSLLTRVEEIAEEQRVADAGPAVQAVQKTVETHKLSTNSADSQVQFLDKVVVIPVVVQHQVYTVQVAQQTYTETREALVNQSAIAGRSRARNCS